MRVSISPHPHQHLLLFIYLSIYRSIDRSIYLFLIIAIISGYGVIPHCGFGLYFPDDWFCWVSFVCLLAICIFSSEKCLFKSWKLLHWVVCHFLVWFWECFICPLSEIIWKYFLPYYRLSFFDNVLWYTNVLNFDEIQFLFCSHVLVPYLTIHC